MLELPTTRPSLVLRIRDAGDHRAWTEFVRIYAPIIYRYGRRRGLQDADAADLCQDVFRSLAEAVRRFDYDRSRGSFRGWLFTLAHHRLYDRLARCRREVATGNDSATDAALAEQVAPPDDEAVWQQEFERRLFQVACEQVRAAVDDATWQAFWLLAVDGLTGQQAAAAVGKTQAAVYLAKSRVTARLRQVIRGLEDE